MFWEIYLGVVAGGVTLAVLGLALAHFGRNTFKG